MENSKKQLGEILIEKRLITPEQLTGALEEQTRTKEFLGVILIKKGYIKEKDLLTALSSQFRIPLVSLKDKYIDWNFVKQFSSSLIVDCKCFPVAKDEWSATFAIVNPLDLKGLEKAEQEARGCRIKMVLVSQGDMEDVIERYRQYIRANIMKLF